MKFRNLGVTTLPRTDTSTTTPIGLDDTPALQLTEPGVEAVYVVNRQDIPPDGGYGWVCAASLFLINAHTWGVNSVSSA